MELWQHFTFNFFSLLFFSLNFLNLLFYFHYEITFQCLKQFFLLGFKRKKRKKQINKKRNENLLCTAIKIPCWYSAIVSNFKVSCVFLLVPIKSTFTTIIVVLKKENFLQNKIQNEINVSTRFFSVFLNFIFVLL